MEIEAYYPTTFIPDLSLPEEKYLQITDRIAEIAEQLEKYRISTFQNQIITFDIEHNPNGTYVIPQKDYNQFLKAAAVLIIFWTSLAINNLLLNQMMKIVDA